MICLVQAETRKHHRFIRSENKITPEGITNDVKNPEYENVENESLQPDPESPEKSIWSIKPEQYMVYIRARREVRQYTGVYVDGYNDYNVITGATCVTEQPITRYLVFMIDSNRKLYTRRIKKILIHPRFNENPLLYNIALLKLNKDFGSIAKPAILNDVEQIYSKCALYYWSSFQRIKHSNTGMQPCPKSADASNFSTFTCFKSLKKQCFKQCSFIGVCNGMLCGLGAGKIVCGQGRSYMAYDIRYFMSFIEKGKKRGIKQLSGGRVFRANGFIYFLLLYCMLHIW